MTTAPGPTVLDAASLLCEVADELVVRTVRDTHTAWVDRVYGVEPQCARCDVPPSEHIRESCMVAVEPDEGPLAGAIQAIGSKNFIVNWPPESRLMFLENRTAFVPR